MKLTGKPATVVSVILRDAVIDHLKDKARERSYLEKQDVSYIDLIREAIDQAYPNAEDDSI